MSTGYDPETRDVTRTRAQVEEPGSGWVAFAAVMVGILGVLNTIYGIGAVSDSKFYVHGTKYILGSLNTWGWFLIVVGVMQIIAAFSIAGRNAYGRWIGVLSAGANSIIALLSIPAYPLLSLALFAVDILVLYGLIAYGGRSQAY